MEDESGGVVIRMVDTTHAADVRSALLLAFAGENRPQPFSQDHIRSAGVDVAMFSRAEIYDWSAFLTSVVFADARREDVIVSGIGPMPNRGIVEISVPGAAEQRWLEADLRRLDIPCGLVEISFRAPMIVAPGVPGDFRPSQL